MRAENMVRKSNDYLVTETDIDLKSPVPKIVAALRQRKTTGQLIIHFGQGGVARIVLVERTRTYVSESEKIREIIWDGQET